MDAPSSQKPYGYVAYIDEAGDFGLRNVAPIDHRGASEWLVDSGVVIRAAAESATVDRLRSLRVAARNVQSSALYFRTLGDRQKRIVCAGVAEMDLRLFVVISNKQNMRRHQNELASGISATRAWFYWWMCRLLMERVTEFCERRNHLENTLGSKLRVEFSRRKDLKYKEFTNYLTRLQLQSKPFLSRRIPRWSVIDSQQIYAFDHETRAGLQLADVVASAFYQAINRVAGATLCPDYAEALSDRVWRGARGEWFDEGFKVFPYPLRFPRLDDSQKRIFRFYGYPDRMW